MNVIIRPFAPEDNSATIEINNLNWPDDPTTLEKSLESDDKRDPKLVFERHVVEFEGRVVAYGTINHHEWMFDPQKFAVYIQVHPEFQNRGMALRLYNFLLDTVAPHNPNRLISQVREDKPTAVRFAQKLGFVETLRSWECMLEVAGFDFTPYTNYHERVNALGYSIKSMAELGDSEAAQREMWKLEETLIQDVPMSEDEVWPSFERYTELVFDSKDYLPNAVFFAIAANGEFVGMSELWSKQPLPELRNGITGVKREHRRKGLALALKLRGIEYAQTHGLERIWTTNESNNRPMLAINEQLGFVKQPALIDVAKDLPDSWV